MGLKVKESEGFCGTIMAGAKTSASAAASTAASASAIRIRENQRRSRARRKEYVEGLERKVHEYEKQGVEATLQMQQAARTVALENSRLRALLARMGAADADVDAYLQSFQDHDAARALESVWWQGQAERRPPGSDADDVKPADDAAGPRHHAQPQPHQQPAALAASALFDKLDVLASASVQQGCCDGRARCSVPESADSRANSPSTVGPSPGAVTPASSAGPHPLSPADQAFGSPMEMSCNAAAQIIAEMQGCAAGDRHLARERLGCNGRPDCLVKNTVLFEMLEGAAGY